MLRPVNDVSSDDGEPADNVGARDVVLRPVDELSSASSAGAQRKSKNKKLRRKRTSTELPCMQQRLCSEAFLRKTLSKSCKKCSQKCMQTFSQDAKFKELQKFREHWSSLHKADQDNVDIWLLFCHFFLCFAVIVP